jgi:hypothetical protein
MQDDRGALRRAQLAKGRNQRLQPRRRCDPRLRRDRGLLTPKLLHRDPEGGAIQPGHRFANLAGAYHRTGERLGHRIVGYRGAASREGKDGPPEAGSGLPEQLLEVRHTHRRHPARLLLAHV